MTSRRLIVAGASLAAFATAVAPAAAQTFTEAWRATGFVTPESASFDPGTNTLFVSNVNSPDFSANGQGYITQLDLDGTVVAERFVEGLNAPKGTYVTDGTLYVAGAGELVTIDIASATVRDRYPLQGSTFLNDVVVTPQGDVFVTETALGAIYRLDNGTLTEWLKDPQLVGPNGIEFEDGALLVALVGDISRGFENMTPTNIKRIDVATKAVTDYGSAEPIGNLDGIELTEGGVLVTDNGGGRVYEVHPDGTKIEVIAPGGGAADFEFIPEEGLIVIPMLSSNEVVAYRGG